MVNFLIDRLLMMLKFHRANKNQTKSISCLIGWMGVEPYCEYDPEVVITAILDDVKDYLEEEINACDYDHGCEYKCQIIDEVPTCTCQEGYVIDDVTTCIDIDECAKNNGGCEHNCLNKPGTFQCKYLHNM